MSNLCNEAALTATRRGASEVQLEDFSQAVERIVAGLEKKHRLLHPLERKVVAYHESGHALVGSLLLQGERTQKVSIIPRGIGALGYTLQRPLEDRYLMTRDELDNKLAVLMGGRAAEQLMLGRLSTGAADDLAKATELARSMATRYGMVGQLGHMAYDLEPPSLLGAPGYSGQHRAYSEFSAQKVEAAVKDILDRAFNQARAILTNNRRILEATASKLLEQETLSERELQELFAAARLPEAGDGKGMAPDAENLSAAPS